MSDSSENHACPQCGVELPEDAPRGLCPSCLMAEAMAPTEGAETARPAPPSIEEVQEAFPQLEILELIGVGGMGVVYRARQTSLNRIVALKLLAPHCKTEPGFADRFTREAQALAALSHPNIVTVHDFGQAEEFFYLIMEFVEGVNLREALKTNRFSPEEALAVVPPICEALQYAHDRGIVHRDIKPENLLLDTDGKIKVADFGIARILDQAEQPAEDDNSIEDPGLTAGTALGTPRYMAPEQGEHPESVDHRADIYSLGAVFYEMLTGEVPSGPILPPSQQVQVDVRLDEIVLRALADSPELRWQSAADLRTQVETVVQYPALSGEVPPPLDTAPTVRMPSQEDHGTTSLHASPGRGWFWLAIALLVPGIPVGALGGWVLAKVLQDPNWNPAPAEALFSISVWVAGSLLLLGGAAAFIVYLTKLPSPSRRRALWISGGVAALLFVLSTPVLVLVSWQVSVAKARDLAVQQQTEAEIRTRQIEIEEAESRLSDLLREHDEDGGGSFGITESERKINELEQQLEAKRAEIKQLQNEWQNSSPRPRGLPVRGVSFGSILILIVGLVVIALPIGLIFLIARNSRSAALGCTLVFLVIGLGMAALLLGSFTLRAVSSPSSPIIRTETYRVPALPGDPPISTIEYETETLPSRSE